ncbi:MAG TPA: lysozyme inhibitor LprI family protein [Luteibacter sp.]|jgi:hypothetical protein|uniref:lysozyme inhibitor LprI family protein n=1 Tax=Luteibacter sp. TaxID=1886636 RepID=UPI002F3FE7FA
MHGFKGLTVRRRAWILGAMAYALVMTASAAPAPQEADAAYDAQDVRLNAAYKKLAQSLDEAGRKSLRNEERQWIVGRDTACKVSAGTVVKNQCTTTQTSFRADELEKRAKGSAKAPAAGAVSALAGDWAYQSDCNLGHDAELSVQATSSAIEGTWSDGTRTSGSQGRFKGDWRDGKLFVRFCTEDDANGGYPACPAYSDVSAYMVPDAGKLTWYRTTGGKASKYVVLDRKPKGGDVPKDTKCKEAG